MKQMKNQLTLVLASSLLVLLGSWSLAEATSTFIIQQGGTGTTTAPVGQLLYGGTSSYQSTATTSVTCTGSASCSGFTVIGSSPITINATGGGGTSGGGVGFASTSVSNESIQFYGKGYVGIGTTTPRFLLSLATSTAPQLNLSDGSLTSNQWAFRNAGGNLYLGTASPTTFATTTPTLAFVNGFVGIGTPNPAHTLDVYGGATSVVGVGDYQSGNPTIYLSADTSLGVVSFNDRYAFPFTILTNNTERMRIDENGKVGIGTSSPAFLLNLAVGTAPQLALSDASLTSPPWTLRSAAGNLYFATSSPSTFATSSATAVTISKNGYVGIGTTNPRGALDVQTGGTNSSVTWNGNQLDISGGTNPGFRVYQNGTAGWYFYNGAGGNNFGIFDITAGKDRMVIYDTGQIDFGNSFGSPYMRMSSTGSFGVGSTTPWGRLSADSTNLAAGQPSFVVGSSSRTDLIVTQAGNVGIGTTTPSQVLSISGKVYTTSGVQFGDGTLQTTAAAGVAASNPTFQHLTSTATSTYTTPAGVTALFIRMCGAGGGGDQNGVGNATAGAATYFGSGAATTTALGAAGGTNSGSNDGGAGGTGGATSLGTEIQRINGAQGNTTGNTAAFPGGSGGSSPFGGAAPGVDANSTASNAATNSCSGGGGLSGDTLKHGGGGAGEYVEFTITSPAATYRYAVGVPGQASATRGLGGAGNIIVQEFYH